VTTKRDFLTISDFTRQELTALLQAAGELKRLEQRGQPLEGKSVGLLFATGSTRTRVSFEVGAHQLGAQPVFLSANDVQLTGGEHLRDTARALSRYLDLLVVRTEAPGELVELARYATVPVINARTHLLHPGQVLGDLLTIQESLGSWEGKIVAWVGDGSNVANAWIDAGGLLGFELRLACPEGYEPNRELFERNASRTTIMITEEPEEAVAGAHVVSTDAWTRSDQEADAEQRRQAFQGYEVTAALLGLAAREAIFLQEAENRLEVQKALMVKLVGR
jgi:ornithine carbamoyltransferase